MKEAARSFSSVHRNGKLAGRSSKRDGPHLGIRTGSEVARYVLAFLIIVGGWAAFSAEFGSPVLFPGPVATAERGLELILRGQLQSDIAISLQRITIGFLIGSVVGASIGLAMGVIGWLRDALNPLVNFFRFIAPTAWIVAAMVWFGLGEASKIFLIVYATLFTVLLNAMFGVMSVRRQRLRAAACFGADHLQTVRYVTLPSAVPFILTGMRMSMMNAFMVLVAAEMVAAQSGLGFLIYNSRQWMETDSIFVGMITLGVLGIVADRLFVFMTHTVLRRFSYE